MMYMRTVLQGPDNLPVADTGDLKPLFYKSRHFSVAFIQH